MVLPQRGGRIMNAFPAGCGLLIIYACVVLYRSLRGPRKLPPDPTIKLRNVRLSFTSLHRDD